MSRDDDRLRYFESTEQTPYKKIRLPETSQYIGNSGSGGITVPFWPRREFTLFLDFDGVLHSTLPGSEKFSALALLQDLLRRHPQVEVVISSSWRETYSFEDLVHLFDEDLRSRIVGGNPVLAPELQFGRQRECETWMSRHSPPGQEWIAMDDEGHRFEPACQHVFHVDGQKGLQPSDIQRLDGLIEAALARIPIGGWGSKESAADTTGLQQSQLPYAARSAIALPSSPTEFEPVLPGALKIVPLMQRAETLIRAVSGLKEQVLLLPEHQVQGLRLAMSRRTAVATNRMEGESDERLILAHMVAADPERTDSATWALRFTSERLQQLHHELFSVAGGHAGQFRQQEVLVGRHRPPTHAAVPEFIARWTEVIQKAPAIDSVSVVVTAAAHQRLAWIHPFADGNGRLARLQTHQALEALDLAPDLWSPLHAFLRTAQTYRQRIAAADLPRRHDFDGRGPLSESDLAEWVEYAIQAWLDEVQMVSRILSRLEKNRGKTKHED